MGRREEHAFEARASCLTMLPVKAKGKLADLKRQKDLMILRRILDNPSQVLRTLPSDEEPEVGKCI